MKMLLLLVHENVTLALEPKSLHLSRISFIDNEVKSQYSRLIKP